MSTDVLTAVTASHRTALSASNRLVAGSRSGLLSAMTARIRKQEPLPTMKIGDLEPRASMFAYDASEAVALTELPHRI